MFRRSSRAKANRANNRALLQEQDEVDRAKKETKEAKRVEKRAALQARYETLQAKKKETMEARASVQRKPQPVPLSLHA
jgi:hypothetical protein